MKRIFLRCFTVLLEIALLTGLLPIMSSAADDELVLTKIGHASSDAVSITTAATRSVMLTVPFSYAGNTIDLSTDLTIEKAASIRTVITHFYDGSTASVGDGGSPGSPVSMTVLYYKDGNTAQQYRTAYHISVVRAERKIPVFSGTITKDVSGVMPNVEISDIVFTADDFLKQYTANDGGALTGVSIAGSSLSSGCLKISSGNNFVNYISGTVLSLADLKNLVFDAVGTGSVSYIVSAYWGGDTTNAIGTVILTITVNGITAPAISSPLSKSVNAGSVCAFSLSDFSNLVRLYNGTLDSIEITPTNTGAGVWLNGTSPFTGTTAFTASTIGHLTFSANDAGTAAFTWRVSNEAGFSDPGSGSVTVKTTEKPTITSSVAKSVSLGTTLVFSLSDFSSCYSLNNGTLGRIVITPSSSNCGTWYKGSSVFTGSKAFTKDDISTLKFKSTQCGQAQFTWTVSNEKGTSATASGMITVNAAVAGISWSTALNTRLTFAASDFNAACNTATGANLSHVYFTLPPASCGTLYYGYSSPSNPGSNITSNTTLYYKNSPKISDVTFVPAANYTGTFVISYTGFNTNNIIYAGEIKMTVGNAGDVSYHTARNAARTFDATDFNMACVNVTGSNLSYVYLTLPSSSCGTLYYGYSSPSNPGTAVGPNSSYSMQNLSYITFVPAANYNGTLSIPYTGVALNNVAYTGYVMITVGGSGVISYTTNENKAIGFAAADFNAACLNLTGSKLHFVRFMLPSAADGKLYYGYSSISSHGSAVSADTAFYMEAAPYIGYVACVPAADFSGTLTVSYFGYSINGTLFTGNITIKVSRQTGSANFADVGPSYEWAAGAIDYMFDAGIVNGTGGNRYSPGANMTRGDFLLMLYRAMGYKGSTKSNFSDVPKGSYYYDAIAVAKALGIAKGSNNKIGPTTPLTRQDAMVYIHRALLVTGVTPIPGTSADIAPYTDKATVSKYALEAVETLVKAGMIKGTYDKLNPTAVLSRAEMAVVLYRVKINY